MSSICSYEVKRRPQLRHSRRRRMVAPSRLSRESTTRSWFSEQKGHFMAAEAGGQGARPSFLGVERDVEAQEELLEARRVLDLHLQVADGVHHPVLLVLHLEADDEPEGALEDAAPQGQLDGAEEHIAAISGCGGQGGTGSSRPPPGRPFGLAHRLLQ